MAPESPAAFVAEDVVAATQQHEVGEVGGAAVGPVNDVVCIAPPGWAVAAGEDTAAVAMRKGAVLGWARVAGASAEVEDLGAASGHDPAEPGVAGEAQRGVAGDGADAGEIAADRREVGGRATDERVEVDGDVDARGRPPRGSARRVGGGERFAHDLDEEVGPALGAGPRATGRVGGVGAVAGFEGGDDGGAAFGVELEVTDDGAAEAGRGVQVTAAEALVGVLAGGTVVGEAAPPAGRARKSSGRSASAASRSTSSWSAKRSSRRRTVVASTSTCAREMSPTASALPVRSWSRARRAARTSRWASARVSGARSASHDAGRCTPTVSVLARQLGNRLPDVHAGDDDTGM